jgi:hypothetical protein
MIMKKVIFTGMIFMLTLTFLHASGSDAKSSKVRKDSLNYIEITGKLVDNNTDSPVVFASVFISGTSIATVSNIDGEFILKVPKDRTSGKVSFSHLGYQNTEIDVSQLINNKKNVVKLAPVNLTLDEVVIRTIDPEKLILKALEKVSDNYSKTPEMQTAFYRETIKQDKKYVAVSEAVLDIYKAPYKLSFDSDRMKVYKGRKSRDLKKMDTLVVKLQGGPRTSLLLDVVKNPGDLLDPENFKNYSFELSGITSIDNRDAYVIKFDQVGDLNFPLFMGNIYIDVQTTSFVGFDFSISTKGLPSAAEYLVKKKPANLKIEVGNTHYLVKYRKDNDEWYLTYVRSELSFSTKWDKKLFKSNFDVMLEMAVTDRDKTSIEKFPLKETEKLTDIFTDQVGSFEDPNFWGDYNTIKPDESIQVAIQKLDRKLKRRE